MTLEKELENKKLEEKKKKEDAKMNIIDGLAKQLTLNPELEKIKIINKP